MSLDVYLEDETKPRVCSCCNQVITGSFEEVYISNVTHNLNKMAGEAGIYEALWRPEEIGITHAHPEARVRVSR